jgi:hypothetical protein
MPKEKSPALLAAQRFWNLLGRPEQFRKSAAGWEPAMRNLMDDAGFDLSGVREFLNWCLKTNSYSAEYLRLAHDPMASLRKNQEKLLRRFDAYRVTAKPVSGSFNPFSVEPWNGYTQRQIQNVAFYCFLYAGDEKGNPNVWYSQNVRNTDSFRRLFDKMLEETPKRWKPPLKNVPDPACEECGGKGIVDEMEHDYMGRKGLDVLRCRRCTCVKTRLMTPAELKGVKTEE